MLTIFTVPKPFRGRIGEIQRNAIASWRALHSEVQIVLVGDEEGVAEAAGNAGVEHARGLAYNDRGTPRLDSAFGCAAELSRWPLWCFVNADIVLLDDFPSAIRRVTSRFPKFLIVGESRDLDVPAGTPLGEASARRQLRRWALHDGRLRGYAALDYFVFPRGLFDPIPPFLIGRACFDNWLVWRARDRRHPVVDVTRGVVVVHQAHDYSHVAGGLDEAYYGDEAHYNEQLAGGRDHIYSLHEATHRLYPHGPPLPYPGSIFRAREKARLAKVSVDIHLAARRERKNAVPDARGPLRLLGIFAATNAEITPLLDALAGERCVQLDVVYPIPPAGGDMSEPLPRHTRWFARTTRLRSLDRVLGREYPITWTVWHSFYFLRPDCMLIGGWTTFPAQAAIAWCTAFRIPYLMLVTDAETTKVRARPKRGLLRAAERGAVAVLEADVQPRTLIEMAGRARTAQTLRRTRRRRAAYGAVSRMKRSLTRRARTQRIRSALMSRRR